VRLFGALDVACAQGERQKFRSKSAASLLAYLLLHPGKEISRFELEEVIWPDSDADKQAQNLRRAVADLRDILECGQERGSIIETKRDVVSANLEAIACDTFRFVELTEFGLAQSDETALLEATSLYSGPLLASRTDEWIHPYRMEFEERFGQAIEALCQLKIQAGAQREAVRLARTAVHAAPTREDIHIALISGYHAAGLEAEAIRQFEDLERMIDEIWGEAPSERARDSLNGSAKGATSVPVQPSDVEASGGAMSVHSRFYVARPADSEARVCIDRRESVVLIQGPRQVGKSSMLARLLDYARQRGVATVVNDFQTIGESQLADEVRLYKTLAHSLASQLKLELDINSSWSEWLGPNMNLDAILGDLLRRADGSVCWAIDEADSLFGRTYAGDFFGLLRSWHNRRALDPSGPWSKLTLALAYATEAQAFITDINQSPFNVGIRLSLTDFSREEANRLAPFYQLKTGDIDKILEVTSGHPFLTRRGMAFVSDGGSADELRQSACSDNGPFGDHLRSMLGSIMSDSVLLDEVRRFLAGETFSHPTSLYRLQALGILTPSSGFRVPAYGAFLRSALA